MVDYNILCKKQTANVNVLKQYLNNCFFFTGTNRDKSI